MLDILWLELSMTVAQPDFKGTLFMLAHNGNFRLLLLQIGRGEGEAGHIPITKILGADGIIRMYFVSNGVQPDMKAIIPWYAF